VGGDGSRIVFGKKKIRGEEGIARKCIVVMQQPVLLLPKFGVKYLYIFAQSP
jgi:hypothetical protein